MGRNLHGISILKDSARIHPEAPKMRNKQTRRYDAGAAHPVTLPSVTSCFGIGLRVDFRCWKRNCIAIIECQYHHVIAADNTAANIL